MNPAIRLMAPAAALALFCAVSGCNESTNRTTWEYGESVHSVMQSQILNPEAGGDRPVVGMDGEAALRAAKRHEAMGEDKKGGDGVMEQMAKAMGGTPPAK